MRPKDDDKDGPFPSSIFPESVFPRRIFPWKGGSDKDESTVKTPDWQRRGEDDKDAEQ